MDYYFIKYDKADNESLITSTVVDPRFKNLSFLKKDSKKVNEYYSIASYIMKHKILYLKRKKTKKTKAFNYLTQWMII